MIAIIWQEERLDAKFFYEDIPSDLLDKAQEYRNLLLDAAAEMDDEAMNTYFEPNDLPVNLLKKCVRNGTIKRKFVPVLSGSAFNNKGVQPLLDGVVDFLASPIDIDVIVGIDPKHSEKKIEVKPSEKEKFVAVAFKVMTDKFVGSLTFIRIYSGKLKPKSTVSNALKKRN